LQKAVKPKGLPRVLRLFATPRVETPPYFMASHERVFFSHISVIFRLTKLNPGSKNVQVQILIRFCRDYVTLAKKFLHHQRNHQKHFLINKYFTYIIYDTSSRDLKLTQMLHFTNLLDIFFQVELRFIKKSAKLYAKFCFKIH
jgi:hypothetical protein